jgi:hypothetical protein
MENDHKNIIGRNLLGAIINMNATTYNLSRCDDHEHLGIFTAVSDDASLGKIAHLAPQDELSQCTEIRLETPFDLYICNKQISLYKQIILC